MYVHDASLAAYCSQSCQEGPDASERVVLTAASRLPHWTKPDPNRYLSVAAWEQQDEEDFKMRLKALQEELEEHHAYPR